MWQLQYVNLEANVPRTSIAPLAIALENVHVTSSGCILIDPGLIILCVIKEVRTSCAMYSKKGDEMWATYRRVFAGLANLQDRITRAECVEVEFNHLSEKT